MNLTPWDGKKIKTPGWYSGIPLEKYHSPGICAGPAVSSSNLRTCWSKSPRHMFASWAENPRREDDPPTRPQILGAAAHHLFLGEDGFNIKYVQQPETYPDKKLGFQKPWSNLADHCKRWHKEQRDAGRLVVTPKEMHAIREMAASLQTEAVVQAGLLDGNAEVSGFFKDKETALWVKVRPDVVPMDGPDFVDLKTAREVTTVALQSSIHEYGYNMQGALIWEACEALGQPFAMFTLLFIETTNPWCARAVPVSKEDLGIGWRQNLLMKRWVRACILADHWPGPGADDHGELSMSHAARERIVARLKREGIEV